MVVDGNALVRQGINAGYFRTEYRIGEMAEGKALTLDQRPHDFRSRREIEDWRLSSIWRRFGLGEEAGGCNSGGQFQEATPTNLRRFHLPIFPPVDSGKRDTDDLRQSHLGQAEASAESLDLLRVILVWKPLHC